MLRFLLKKFRQSQIKRKWKKGQFPLVFGLKIGGSAKLESCYRELAEKVSSIVVPDNEPNQVMGMILQAIRSFNLSVTRYNSSREALRKITVQENDWRRHDPKRKSWPSHPDSDYINAAVRVDVESLFIFGLILVNRVLLLLKIYLPDELKKYKSGGDQYSTFGRFYHWLVKEVHSNLANRMRADCSREIKWLYAVLTFYRNEFVEHMNKSYQQGMMYSSYTNTDFSLHSYSWKVTKEDEQIVSELKSELANIEVSIPETDNPRSFAQFLFEHIVDIPDHLVEKSTGLIAGVGGDSPNPRRLARGIEDCICRLFDFLIDNFEESKLAKYPKK